MWENELFRQTNVVLNHCTDASILDNVNRNLFYFYERKNDFEKAESELASYKEKFPLDDSIRIVETELEMQKKEFEKKQEELLKAESSSQTEQEQVELQGENTSKVDEEQDVSKESKKIKPATKKLLAESVDSDKI